MGLLTKAGEAHEEPKKEAHKKESKHKAKAPVNASEGDEVSNAQAPTGQPALDDDSDEGASSGGDSGEQSASPSPSDAGDQGEDDSAPSAPAGDAQEQSGVDAGGDSDSPQPPQGADAQSPDNQADQSGGDQDASPSGSDAGQSAPAGAAGQDSPDSVDFSQLKMPPAMKEAYQRANGALLTALYKNDKVAQAVLSGIVPQGIHKIESVVHVSMTVFMQINKQLNFIKEMPQIAVPFLNDVLAHVTDLATQVKGIQFSDQESAAIMSTAHEFLFRVVGINKGQMRAATQHIPRSQLAQGLAKYQAHIKATQNVSGRFSQGAGGAQGNPAAGGQPSAAQPQSGAPQGAPAAGPQPGPAAGAGGTPGGQPQPGAPVTAAPGPGQSAPPGGMLSAAAAQPPGQ
jgi:hypothetical protein